MRDLRCAVTVLEMLLATFLLLLVVVFLWNALSMASRGAGKAEWVAAQERKLESFHHILAEELRRANHLITMDVTQRWVHDPRFSAVWVLKGGHGVGFRVFESDQAVVDPVAIDLSKLRQDQVFFVLRGEELLFLRHGELGTDEVRVLLPHVTSLVFRPSWPYERTGPMAGALTVEIEILDEDRASRLTREWSLPTAVPVLYEDAPPAGEEFLPPPPLADPPGAHPP